MKQTLLISLSFFNILSLNYPSVGKNYDLLKHFCHNHELPQFRLFSYGLMN